MVNNSNGQKPPAIKAENLKKYFNDIKAVDDVSFEIKKGEIFGFLGPNGAGKTTTINMLCTLLKPDGGRIVIDGFDAMLEESKVRSSLGLVFQESILDTHLSVEENIYLHALLYGLDIKQYRKRLREILKLVELWDRRKSLIDKLSGGMRRRAEIARALIHLPKILFLDEPTVGLDPQTRKKIWDYLFDARKETELTIFLTTQYINEAEDCDRVAIIDNGKIVALDKPEKLKEMMGGDVIYFRSEDNDLALEEIKKQFPLISVYKFGKYINLETEKGDEFLPQLVKTVTSRILSMELHRPTLEDVFLKLTGRKIREEKENNGD